MNHVKKLTDSELLLDAHNTYQKDPTLPSELLRQRDEAVRLLGHIVDADVDSFVDAGGYDSHTTEHRCLVCGSSYCESDCTMTEIRTFLDTLKP